MSTCIHSQNEQTLWIDDHQMNPDAGLFMELPAEWYSANRQTRFWATDCYHHDWYQIGQFIGLLENVMSAALKKNSKKFTVLHLITGFLFSLFLSFMNLNNPLSDFRTGQQNISLIHLGNQIKPCKSSLAKHKQGLKLSNCCLSARLCETRSQ